MSDIFNSETLWLTTTNIVLGLVTLVCLTLVLIPVFKEVYGRLAIRSRVPLANDSHAFNLSDLGITMADGGTPFDETTEINNFSPEEISDPSNIYRSIN